MSASSSVDARVLATVTVTFNPDLVLLEAQLRALPDRCVKVIVDNASQPDLIEQIAVLSSHVPNAMLVRNGTNVGLAAAVNLGVEAVATLATIPEFVLLLDQDSEPQPGSVVSLVHAFQCSEAQGSRVGCVGPLLRDPDTGLTHGFHQRTRWRWRRVYPPAGSDEPVPCANLNGSGTLVKVALFRQLGGLDESFFIDHVDTEWAFRLLASGYTLWGIPGAVFDHRMGQSSIRIWCFGWRLWPVRSPQRHYFLFRNAVILMGRNYVPRVWKWWAVVKLLITVAVTGIAGPARSCQISRMLAGVCSAVGLRKARNG